MPPSQRLMSRLCQCALPTTARASACRRPAWRVPAAIACYAQASAGGDAVDTPITFRVSAQELSGKGKVRVDAFLAAQLQDTSRARVASSIKAGLVTINGAPCTKPSTTLALGDRLAARLLPPEPTNAEPESIPLDVVYEDDALLVVNKPAGMVVHISPGHIRGTLVNALLAHCSLPGMDVPSGAAALVSDHSWGEDEDLWEEGEVADDRAPAVASPSTQATAGSAGGRPAAGGILRPGIVHRLDKGTTGLMVVAKQATAHEALCAQFKARTVSRTYRAITLRVPSALGGGAGHTGRVTTNIVRDPANRLRMTAAPYGSLRGRTAASRWRVLEVLAGGGAALVEWRLETGRTHQIRVHAKHLGHPLFGDDMYGATPAAAVQALAGTRTSMQAAARELVARCPKRPALHALTLGFQHPVSGAELHFSSQLPDDFAQLLDDLRGFGDDDHGA